jgi:hypothetical protein
MSFVSKPSDPTRRTLLRALCCAPALCMAPRVFASDLVQTGSVTIEQVQIAFIGSGNLGGGTLIFKGQKYDFSVGGLGVGGIGVSKMQAHGAVYNLYDLSDFPGAYVQARYGLAVGSTSTGELWLRNSQGVALRLEAERSGLALSLGGDAVYIDFD